MNETLKNKPGYSRIGIIITLVIIATGLAAFFVFRGGREETIKIGAILPLTGVGERIGIEARDGMILAVDGINFREGINGRKIQLIFEDSRTDPQEGKRAFHMIEETHRPLFYVSVLSTISMAVASLSEENRVVLFGTITATGIFTKKKEWVFRYYHTAELDARPLISILQELRVKNLGIIYINDEYGVSVFEIVGEMFHAMGGIIRCESFEAREVDYIEQIEKLKDLEAICFIGFVPHIQKAFKQLRKADYDGIILSAAGACDPVITSMPEANGVYVSAPIIFDPDYLFAREAKERYETRHNKPFNMFAAANYDFLIFIAGLLKDKEISRENLRVVLEQGFIYPGVFGVLDVKPGEHEINFPLHPARIVDGGLQYLH